MTHEKDFWKFDRRLREYRVWQKDMRTIMMRTK